jgi:hypothetical protein
MAQIICIIGNKGGTGKTTVCHMLCQGLGLLGKRSVCVLTDVGREPLDPEGRRYLIADARSREALAKVVDKIHELDGWMGVIDGGANRHEVDRRLYAIADLVLLPFRESHEDVRTLIQDLDTFPRAYALPSQWPTNTWQRDAANKAITQLLARYRDRILDPVTALSASKLLLQRRLPEITPTPLNNACRRVAGQVLDVMRETYEDCALDTEEVEDEHNLPLANDADTTGAGAYAGTTHH